MISIVPRRNQIIIKTNEARDTVSVFIIAKSDRMRDSLESLLESKPGIKLAGQTDDYLTAMTMITQHRPGLVILDTNLAKDQAWITALTQAKSQSPQTRYLVVTDTTRNINIAQAAGADAVLIKGFALARLFTVIENLLEKGQAL